MLKVCLECQKEFIPKRKEQSYCTRSCASVKKGKGSSSHMKGKRNAWKGGRRVDAEGYVRIYDPSTQDYQREHRLMIGAKAVEVVHHINGDTQDNRPENLEITNFVEHSKYHASQREKPKHGEGGRFIA